MKKYLIDYWIKDGDYEYYRQTLIEAENKDQAFTDMVYELETWTCNDERTYEITKVLEIPLKDFNILLKYIN